MHLESFKLLISGLFSKLVHHQKSAVSLAVGDPPYCIEMQPMKIVTLNGLTLWFVYWLVKVTPFQKYNQFDLNLWKYWLVEAGKKVKSIINYDHSRILWKCVEKGHIQCTYSTTCNGRYLTLTWNSQGQPKQSLLPLF